MVVYPALFRFFVFFSLNNSFNHLNCVLAPIVLKCQFPLEAAEENELVRRTKREITLIHEQTLPKS